MRLKVLVDNNTMVGKFFKGEAGLSFFIEDGQEKVLLDLGYSGVFLENAIKMGIDPAECTTVALSHGHIDHTGGMDAFLKHFWEGKKKDRKKNKPRLISHPDTLQNMGEGKDDFPGNFTGVKALEKTFNIVNSREPVWITERLVFLGEIERKFSFEGKKEIQKDGTKITVDYLPQDTALAYRGKQGLVIITGCSHSGICNITEYAKKVSAEERVVDIVGGLHLQKPSRDQLDGTREYIATLNLEKFHACHCTDLKSKMGLSKAKPVSEVGVGLELIY